MPSHWVDAVLAAAPPAGGTTLRLLDGPFLSRRRRERALPVQSQRLVVLVALRHGRTDRRRAAALLWPGCDTERAAGNLRTALWRLHGAGLEIVRADKTSLWLHESVAVDLDLVSAWTERLVQGAATPADLCVRITGLDSLELLDGWDDDWLVVEREQLRQRLLHALEAMVRRLLADGRAAEAVDVALRLVAADPLRESAHEALVRAHLAEGNRSEARRTYAAYRAMLAAELGIAGRDRGAEHVPGPARDGRVTVLPAR